MDLEPEQPPEPNIPREIYLTEEQNEPKVLLVIKALVDSLDVYMPGRNGVEG